MEEDSFVTTHVHAATRIQQAWKTYAERSMCRICLEAGAHRMCACRAPIHRDCLLTWMRISRRWVCEICKTHFIMCVSTDEYEMLNPATRCAFPHRPMQSQLSLVVNPRDHTPIVQSEASALAEITPILPPPSPSTPPVQTAPTSTSTCTNRECYEFSCCAFSAVVFLIFGISSN